MMLYTLVMQFYFQNGLKQKKMTPFWGKNTEEEQNSATTIISVDGKGTVFSNEVEITRTIISKNIKKRA